MSDHDDRDTVPSNAPPEPSLRQLLERIEAAVSLAADTRAAVAIARVEIAALKDDVKAARHAAAVAADEALAHRSEVSRVVERIDLIDADGCGRYRAHMRAGNGGGG
jgi:hypothetical protein